ncbi:hypothetical protein ACFCXH_00305 [Streptomyces nojiriensis]|uniref:hypothetical protein n=1 Tax=Streptomyces nojiriensis TaxID=66374 RepID=UPI0035DA560E
MPATVFQQFTHRVPDDTAPSRPGAGSQRTRPPFPGSVAGGSPTSGEAVVMVAGSAVAAVVSVQVLASVDPVVAAAATPGPSTAST